MTRAEKRAAKIADTRIERAYYDTCTGIQIDIMDIGKVFEHGRRLITMDHVNDEQLRFGIREYVETIRQN